MLKEFYVECKNNFIAFEETLEGFVANISKIQDSIQVEEFLQHFQNAIINFGESLEKNYGLYDTEIIIKLEELCELVYNYSQCIVDKNNIEQKYLYEKMKCYPQELLKAFDASCKLTDYYLTAVLIAKNEDRYIKEWIEYHKIVGFKHFYIFDNDSSPTFKEALDPYIENGEVTYIWFPGEKMQLNAYNYALDHFRFESQYMAFIDADEFIISPKYDTIKEAIEEIISNYINLPYRSNGRVAGIGLNWRMFGTSFHKERFSGLMIENLKYRAEDYNGENVLIKTICNPRRVNHFDNNPHECNYKSGYICISERGSIIPGSYFADSAGDILRINHYYLKTEQEYIEKCMRGWPDREYSERLLENKAKEKFDRLQMQFDLVLDNSMDRYIAKVKEALAINKED